MYENNKRANAFSFHRQPSSAVRRWHALLSCLAALRARIGARAHAALCFAVRIRCGRFYQREFRSNPEHSETHEIFTKEPQTIRHSCPFFKQSKLAQILTSNLNVYDTNYVFSKNLKLFENKLSIFVSSGNKYHYCCIHL